MQRTYQAEDGTQYRVETEQTNGGRLFLAAHGLQVEIQVTAYGVTITTTKGNDTLHETTVETPDEEGGNFEVYHQQKDGE